MTTCRDGKERALVCGTQLSLCRCCRCIVSPSPCARHFGSKLQTRDCLALFCAYATSLCGETVIRTCVARVYFADSSFQDLVPYLAFKPAEVDILSKTLGIEEARNPLTRSQLWKRPPYRICCQLSNLGRRRTLLPPFGFSKNLCCSPHLHLLPTQPLPQLQNSAKQSLKFGGQSPGLHPPSRVCGRPCDHVAHRVRLEILLDAVLHRACSELKCLNVFRLLQMGTACFGGRGGVSGNSTAT